MQLALIVGRFIVANYSDSPFINICKTGLEEEKKKRSTWKVQCSGDWLNSPTLIGSGESMQPTNSNPQRYKYHLLIRIY